MRQAFTALLLVALACAPALAHGGQYQGPGTGVGGGTFVAPGDMGKPPAGSGAHTPHSPGAVTPSPAPGPGASTGGAGARTGAAVRRGGPQGAVQSGGSGADTTDYETWEFWWEANKDQFLELKSHLVRATAQTGLSGSVAGRGAAGSSVTSSRPDFALIKQTIIPTLQGLLANSTDQDILDSSLIALGRVAREDSMDEVIAAAMPLLASKSLSVRTSSALCLGVLGSPRSVPSLVHLMADDAKGRQLVAGKDVDQVTRALSALSLGLIDDPGSVKMLIDIVEEVPDAQRDLKAAAILALGLAKDNANRDDAYKFLIDRLHDSKLDAVIKSYVPTSLGKLGDPTAVGDLLECFQDRDTEDLVRQSASIGLGLLADISQKNVVQALTDYVTAGHDAQTRHYCLIGLAQIGRRDADRAQEHKDAHQKLAEFLGREIDKPADPDHRSWAALAAAIYAREGGMISARAEFVASISAAWKKEKDPSYKGAFAIALGLLNAQDMAPVLFDEFGRSQEPDERGYTAVALGFLKYKDAGEELRQQCNSKAATPTYRLQVATALGLMGDQQAVPVLVAALQDAQTLSVSSAVAKALGLIGDADAIGPLKAIAEDPGRQMIARAFACVALGLVGEKTDLPWNARIRADNNYRARVQAIAEVLDVL